MRRYVRHAGYRGHGVEGEGHPCEQRIPSTAHGRGGDAPTLFNYADKAEKGTRDAYRDFLDFDMFTSEYNHYYIRHTQTYDAAGGGSASRISACSSFRDDYALPIELYGADRDLVRLMPALEEFPWADVGFHSFSTAQAVAEIYGTSLPDKVLALVTLRAIVEDVEIEDIVSEAPLAEVMTERRDRAVRLFDVFLWTRETAPDVSVPSWFCDMTGAGFLPLAESIPEDDLPHLEQIMLDDHRKRQEILIEKEKQRQRRRSSLMR